MGKKRNIASKNWNFMIPYKVINKIWRAMMEQSQQHNPKKIMRMIQQEEIDDLMKVLEMTDKINESKTRMMDNVYKKMIPKPKVL